MMRSESAAIRARIRLRRGAAIVGCDGVWRVGTEAFYLRVEP